MNRIHPSAVIGPDVRLGVRNRIGPYAVIVGSVEIGDDNWIGPSVVIGTPAEVRGGHHDAGWDGESGAGTLSIGHRNVIREFTTIQAGTSLGTHIGSDCYFMDKVHVPHDCVIGDLVTISCASMIAGHVIIGDRANLGLGTIVHQRLVIGEASMIGMGSVITRHIEPFALAYGSPARVRGANRVGLERIGSTHELIDAVDRAHRDGTGLIDLIPDELRRFEANVRSVTTSHP